MSEVVTGRAFPRLSEEAFKKIQDLQGALASNQQGVEALTESVDLHTLGLGMLQGEEVSRITEQFEYIIQTHTKSRDNLIQYNQNAEEFLAALGEVEDPATLELIEKILKLVAFK